MPISQVIPEQMFEQIRDAIGSIMTSEFASQAGIQTDPEVVHILNNVVVFKERLAAIDSSDDFFVCPIMYAAGYDNQSQQVADGANTFFIDCYGRGKQNDGAPLEQVSAVRLQRLVGIIRYIFEHPLYRTLGFAPGRIMNSHITSIQRTQIEKQEDADNMAMYRITMVVNATECTDGETDGVPLARSTTTVLVNETDKGFIYQVDVP